MSKISLLQKHEYCFLLDNTKDTHTTNNPNTYQHTWKKVVQFFHTANVTLPRLRVHTNI